MRAPDAELLSDVEILIVGGGPVGLVAAIRARAFGFDVAIIEPRPTPIDKACGEGLMPGAVRALELLGVRPAGMDFRGIRYLQGATRAEHVFTNGPGRGVRRIELHRALAERADALGVGRITGRVEHLVQDANGVTVSGPGLDRIRADWLVGCDGLHSTVRQLVGLAAAPQQRSQRRFGLRRHFRTQPWSDFVEVHWSDRVEAYVTPVGAQLVGVALLGPVGADFDAELSRIPELGARLSGAAVDGPVRGAGPLRQRSAARTAGRVLLTGDASGYVDALTGEGLRVGFAQADAAVRAVRAGDLRRYEREWVRVTRDFRVLTSGLVAAGRSGLRSKIVPASSAAPRLFGAVVERLAR
ncbi:NAD(P)/FAD-dependent oxidoreductase [Rathayibacter soli]|uniref:NAD(P)/FAD-dependent oxidoreductase n=1 Tax=Rathayibacter soli TaxID=3144168 RepID=UPI0027E4088D|nr:NAD(P)/FAD-dependent oxidoreductase [Glaciibacter superstes]